jgi:hypothetical protein
MTTRTTPHRRMKMLNRSSDVMPSVGISRVSTLHGCIRLLTWVNEIMEPRINTNQHESTKNPLVFIGVPRGGSGKEPFHRPKGLAPVYI